ncbi:hypothetical protein BK703_16890 [Bacillus thuringiensis serovar silo]|nr:minor capsid protein [Bacillus cereus]OTW55315.1 hypothetical protein BK703_16890 [Bacillus thuringiensis serovar silo]OTW74253.1 hypothetical protein BK700_01155 [Bacillus thuringiensis serovar toguchini]PFQ72436.1 hypothetical protein COK15_28270 [Bacillus cereus]
MHIEEAQAYVNSLVPHTYYAFSFPTTGKDDSAVIIVDAGMPVESSGVERPTLQLLVRGKPDDKLGAYDVAMRLQKALKFRRDFMMGETSVVEMKARQSAPIWTGIDEAKRPIFSLNFELTTRG